MLSVSQQDLHLLGRVFLGLADDLGEELAADAGTTLLNVRMSGPYLDGVLHARSFVQAALADRVGPYADVLFDFIGV